MFDLVKVLVTLAFVEFAAPLKSTEILPIDLQIRYITPGLKMKLRGGVGKEISFSISFYTSQN